MKEIIEWVQGNPGAMECILMLVEMEDPFAASRIYDKIERCESIRGTNLNILWSDLCDRDMTKVANLCTNCPDHILEDACSRQDYSGRELVKEYL